MATRRPLYPSATGSPTQIASPDTIDPSVLPTSLGLTQINATTSGTFTAVAGDIINTSAAATVTLPTGVTIDQCVLVTRGNHTALVTINAGASQTINGAASCSIPAGGAANLGEALFIAQSATVWTAIALGTDLNLGLTTSGTATFAVTQFNSTATFANRIIGHNVTKTANYTTIAGDLWVRGTSGTWTLTLTVQASQIIFATNEGTGIITVASSSGLVIGATTLPAGCSALYICNGTNWDTIATFGFTSTAAGVVVTSPTLGAAAQLANTTVDQVLYISVTTAGTLTVAIGPTSGVANTIVNGLAAAVGNLYTIRLPAGWFVAVTTGTTAAWITKAITC